MSIVKFYHGDPAAPKPNMPARLGANAVITWNGKILLEKRTDSNTWGLIGGGVKKYETELQAITREIWEELGLRISSDKLTKLGVYGEPGRIAAYKDGSVWRMVIVVYALQLEEMPQMRISQESRQLKFFSKEELDDIEIVPTHSDIVQMHFTAKDLPV